MLYPMRINFYFPNEFMPIIDEFEEIVKQRLAFSMPVLKNSTTTENVLLSSIGLHANKCKSLAIRKLIFEYVIKRTTKNNIKDMIFELEAKTRTYYTQIYQNYQKKLLNRV